MQFQLTETRKEGKVSSEVGMSERHVPGRDMSLASCVKARVCVTGMKALARTGNEVFR